MAGKRAAPVTRLRSVELWLSLLFGRYSGAMVVYMVEAMPAGAGTPFFFAGIHLGDSGVREYTPAVCTYLIHLTGNPGMPGVWLSASATCGLAAVLLLATVQKAEQRV